MLCRGSTFVSYRASPHFYSILNIVMSVVWSVMTHWSCVYSRCAVLTVGEGVQTSLVFILE